MRLAARWPRRKGCTAHIYVLKLGALGDALMAGSMLREISKRWPGAKVHWIAGRPIAALIDCLDGVDEVIDVDDRALLRGGPLPRAKALLDLWSKLVRRNCDVLINAHADRRYSLLLTPLILSSGKYIRGRCGAGRRWPVPGRYHADEYLRMLGEGDDYANPRASLPHLRISASVVSQPLEEGTHSRRLILLAPGGARNVLRDDALRRWPVGHYAALAELLSSVPAVKVLIVGSASDSWTEEYFKRLHCQSLIGHTSLPELAKLISSAAMVITHDSGPMHLAAAIGTPLIALFGPTNPDEKLARNKRIRVLWGGMGLPCCPCYDGRTYAPCTRNVCLGNIAPDRVFREAVALLNGTSDRDMTANE